ncbi:anaphase-promoting complex subunit cdc27 [Coemansia sp. RSA 552]|nr:anaphase-promoting complex subunit cdc27 [Coemansia sp. RSA 552]
MLRNPTDAANRKRPAKPRSTQAPPKPAGAARGARSTAQASGEEQSAAAAAQAEDLGRPQGEATRYYYEKLIHRGISLQQPHSVLFVAEAYHGWYHGTTPDVAGCILQRAIGRSPEQSVVCRGADGDDVFDARSAYWLALCYWHMGEVSTVYSLLSPLAVECEYLAAQCDGDAENSTIGGAEPPQPAAGESSILRSKKALACGMWLLAMACTRLEKWQEAEDRLGALEDILRLVYPPDEPGRIAGTDARLALRAEVGLYVVPSLADVSDVLAMVCLRTNRTTQSEEHSADALARNPLLWSSYRRLCELGSTQRLSQALSVHIYPSTADKPAPRKKAVHSAEKTPGPTPRRAAATKKPSTVLRQPVSTRSTAALSSRTRSADPPDPAGSARMRTRLVSRTRAGGAIGASKGALAPKSNAVGPGKSALGPLSVKTPVRSRDEGSVHGEKKRTRDGAAVRVAPVARARDQASIRGGNQPSVLEQQQAIRSIHLLLKRSSLVFMHTASYCAAQALLTFAELPLEQQGSAWGLCVLGRICFETGRYPEAAQAFAEAHRIAPYRLRDMDTYSTLLWHMKHEEPLAQLAHALVAAGRNWSPEAWVAVANCFSLDGDHASALKSLGRSIQLYKASPGGVAAMSRNDAGGVSGLAYAHSLVGHENVALDEMDRAQQAFRTAIRVDSRHYSAWYGLGMSYLRLGKPDLAEYHCKRALALNAQNPLLLQSAGAVYEHRKDYGRALKVYGRVERMLRDGHALHSGDKDRALADSPGAESLGGKSLVNGEELVLGLESHHAMSFVMFKRARVLVILERFGEAAAILEQLLRRCPREFNVPFLLGQTYTRLRRYREAAACLTRALDIAPENSQSVHEALDALYLQDAEDREADLDDMDNSENSGGAQAELPLGHQSDDGMYTPSGGLAAGEDLLTSSSSGGSPYFDSPSLYAGRNDQAEWRNDWRALGNADDRVDRVLDFDM